MVLELCRDGTLIDAFMLHSTSLERLLFNLHYTPGLVLGSQPYLGIEEHGQGLPSIAPVSLTEIILGIPAQGPILAPFQADGVEAGQSKQQAGPRLGLLGAHSQGALGQAAVTPQQRCLHTLQTADMVAD